MAKRDAKLTKAINAVGSARKLAAKIGVSHQAISKWRRVPAEFVVVMEKATGIPREELRPDLYR